MVKLLENVHANFCKKIVIDNQKGKKMLEKTIQHFTF